MQINIIMLTFPAPLVSLSKTLIQTYTKQFISVPSPLHISESSAKSH